MGLFHPCSCPVRMVATLLSIFHAFIADIMSEERTFIMIKPDAVQRGLVADIIKRFEQKGFKLVAMKFMWASKELLQQHYADLSTKPFFPKLVEYMHSGPVVPMVWEGKGVVKLAVLCLVPPTQLIPSLVPSGVTTAL